MGEELKKFVREIFFLCGNGDVSSSIHDKVIEKYDVESNELRDQIREYRKLYDIPSIWMFSKDGKEQMFRPHVIEDAFKDA